MFVGANLVFAGLFMLDPRGAAGIDGFADAFFLSVQTIGNVNLGFGAPTSDYARWVMTAEVFVGLLALALGTGLFFAKISQPSARITFSKAAVISDYEGKPAFMFRVGNRRTNAILDVKVMINVARQVKTREGHSIRRFEELVPIKGSAPLFAYTWTIMHVIDAASPLARAQPRGPGRPARRDHRGDGRGRRPLQPERLRPLLLYAGRDLLRPPLRRRALDAPGRPLGGRLRALPRHGRGVTHRRTCPSGAIRACRRAAELSKWCGADARPRRRVGRGAGYD